MLRAIFSSLFSSPLTPLFSPFLTACLVLGLTAPPSHAAAPPRLIETINGEQPIRLQSLQISSELSGSMAETTVQMVFFNPNSRPLEGNLQFPLLTGQQITAFALDIEGKLRPAVPVEKAKGRQVFEEIERRRVDPALLEVTQGNNFKLRIFPVPAKGTRTVQLKYAEALTRQGSNWRYQLPLAYDDNLQNFSLNLKANGAAAAPQAKGMLRDIKFERTDSGYQANVAKAGFSPGGTLDVQIPASTQAQTYLQERDRTTYFLAEIPVTAATSARPLPNVIGLLWDSSGSGANRAHEAELAELDAYFKALGNGEVRLTRLRDRPEAVEVFDVSGGNWSKLRKALQATVYDGASALANWKPERAVGEYLMVSDGLLNYGSRNFPVLSKGQRLYALNSALSADTSRLAALAESTGGRLAQVQPHSPGAAAHELLTEGAHLAEMNAIGVTNLQVESADPQHGLMRIAGKLQSHAAELQLTVSQGGKLRQMTIPVSADMPNHPLAAHFWAMYRLHALEANPETQRAEIRRIGQDFGIPTSETSLIVLDSVEDYVRYDITPPADYLAEFNQRRNQRSAERKQQRDAHLNQVLQQFAQKLAWWERSFPKTGAPKPKVEQPVALMTPSYAPPPEVVAAPSPMHAPRPATQAGGKQSQEVIVTGIRASQQQSLNVRRRSAESIEAITAEDVGKMPDKNVADSLQRLPGVPINLSSPEQDKVGIALKRWTSDAPYITRMKAAKADTIYAIYLDEKPGYLNSSAFFLDAADMLIEKGQRDLALRVLSNLAEMDLENRHVLRILGYRLLEAGAPELAIPVFEKVQQLAEEEPQSFRDLGLAFAAAKQYQQAIDQLNEAVMRPWDGRFRDVEMITLGELNAIIATAKSTSVNLDTRSIDPRLLKNMPLDLRVVMSWDADNSDMDLWVTDPSGEKCYFAHPLTEQGGHMSLDVTQGYGPEEFSLRVAAPGKYRVEANFYGNRQQTVAGATTLQVKLTTGFGTAKSRDQMVTLRLKDQGETVFVGEFEVKPK